MPRPILATISIAAMRHNLSVARAHAPGRFAWAVVKADGYGHGLENALRGFADADGLALVEFDRASRLREAGWTKPLLMLEGAFDQADVAQAARQQLQLVVHEPRQLDWVERAPGEAVLDVVVKLNSGMNRLGFDRAAFRAAFERLRRLPAVRSVALMTHFADADRSGAAEAPLRRFEEAAQGLDAPRSLANSAAILSLPASHASAIRPGILLYGATPFDDRDARSLGLRAAMTLGSKLIAVQSVAPGEAVGYGSTFRAQRPMRIGIVACGYADGYPRHAPTGTPIAVDGRRTQTVGRVSMDMLAVDLGALPQAAPGAPVELWGDIVPIDEVASAAGTIGYELMCAVAPRVPRRALDD
ncbi:MAG: alanine racemase [Burkholderiales bacterium]|nr:MAG: alanine racemase [Burkholderiales bacterium]